MSELRLQEYEPKIEQNNVSSSKLIEQSIGKEWELGTVTLEVYQAPLVQLISEIATQLDISVLIPKEAESASMSAKYQATQGQRVIEDVSDYLGLVPEFDGDTLRFVDESKAAQDFVVIRSGYKRSAELVEDLTGLLNTSVKVRAVDDRVVVSGTRRDLEQVKRIEQHLQTGPDGWTLNIRIVGVTEAFRRELGMDWDVSGRLGFNSSDLTSTISSEIAVQIIAEATETKTDAYLVYQATIHVLEGSSSDVSQGRKVPIPRYQTSPEGTTTVVGYDYIDAGFKLTVSAQRVPVGVRLSLEPSISTVTGFVGDAPITEESSVRSDLVVEDGQWIIITGLSTEQASSDHKGLPALQRIFGTETRIADKSSLLVMVQARRTFGTGDAEPMPDH